MQKPMFYFIVAFGAISAILYGYDIGVMSGAFLFVRQDIPMTDQQISFVGSAVLGGGAFVTLITGPLSDWFGRKKMMVAAALTFMLGILIVATAHSYDAILAGRLIQGIGVGILTIASPLYLAESVPSEQRGRSVSAFQLLLTTGILVSGFMDLYFTTHGGNWRAMFLSALIPGVLMLLFALVAPESPRWLVMKGKPIEALKVLQKTCSTEEAETELSEMQESLRAIHPRLHETSSIFQKRYMLPLVIVCIVAIAQQLTAINSVLQFGALLLKESGLHSNLIAMTGATGIMALNCITTFIAFCLIDKVGRKPLLCLGTGGLACALFYSAGVMYFCPPGALQGYLLMLGLFAFIIFFAIGPGVVIWLILSELLPMRIRSKGMALGLFLNSLASALLAAFFIPLINLIGAGNVFLMCALFTSIYFIIAWKVLPETNQKTLEEIEELFVDK